jgi:hypothetical protein
MNMDALFGFLSRLASIMLLTLLPAVLYGEYSFGAHLGFSLVVLIIWWIVDPFDPSKNR